MSRDSPAAVEDVSRIGAAALKGKGANLGPEALWEEAVRRNEGIIAKGGVFVVKTGRYTGRSPNDKFIVREPSSEDKIWWGPVNRPFQRGKFDALLGRVVRHLEGRELFVRDCFVGADERYRVSIRVITEMAWHNLFATNMFLKIPPDQLGRVKPGFTVVSAPGFKAVPERDGTNSEAFIVIDFGQKIVLLGGTSYAGEIKKSVFTIMNYLLPLQGVLPMHCSANIGPDDDVALFFGLSGTGKTSLSATTDRTLIGDDEHGWGDDAIFNFEGGCYAKVIRLSREAEPEIYATTEMFGTILENVPIDPETRELDLDDDSVTENTRGSYPLTSIPNASTTGVGGLPQNIFMLTADAFGVMPPIAKLTADQANYHFLSGYTAKVAGTERGIIEPEATFSPCFGAPFMPMDPRVYADMLAQKVREQKVQVWLVNTGWTGGPYGVGHRIKIGYTRAMIRAALDGSLAQVPTEEDPVFQVQVPVECPGVPPEVLKPKNTWPEPEIYDAQAEKLLAMFQQNFSQFQ
ncbi:MAG: phosphoenolpyruvate carboxykinase (ATP) [Dehalococcoidia bacterium]